MTAKGVPLGAERRDAIADAAIHLVASRGLRGLTHRAVDAEAGLPAGSTSYYLRTRHALLAACVDRLLALDERTISERAGVPVVEVLVAMMVRLAREQPASTIARYELTLEATRHPALAALINEHARRLRFGLAPMLADAGIPDAEDSSWPMAAMLDGLLRDRITGLGVTLSDQAFEESVRTSVSALLRGYVASRSLPAGRRSRTPADEITVGSPAADSHPF